MPITKIVSMATDGAPVMKGAINGLVGLLNNDHKFLAFVPLNI